MITVMKGDITRLDFDVIVNPVNTSVTPIGKVGIAIGKAGGYRLTDACQRLKTCQTGQAKMTLAYNLPCKAIIHVAGPIYSGSKKDQEYLEACYWNAMSIAYEYFKLNHLKHMTLAFPCISTDTYGYPRDQACAIAIHTIKDVFAHYPKAKAIDVTFVCNEEQDYLLYKEGIRS